MAWEESTVPPRRMPLRMADPPRRTRGKYHGKVCCEAWGPKLEGKSYRSKWEPRCSFLLLTNTGLSPLSRVHIHSPFQGTRRFVSYELNSWDLEIECHQQSRRQEDKRLSLCVGHWKILNSPKEKNLSKWSLVPQRKKPACFQSCYDESQLTKPMIRVLVPHS